MNHDVSLVDRSYNMVFTQGRGFVIGELFGLPPLVASMARFGLPYRGHRLFGNAGSFCKLIGVATLFDFGEKRCRKTLPVRSGVDSNGVSMAFSQEKVQAAFDRIHELGGGGVWESDMVAISLNGASITDEDLALFADFTVVEILSLADTPITDAGLSHLQHLDRLETLSLVGTDVTPNGVAKLQAALPNAEISTEPTPNGAINPFTGEPLDG